MDTLISFDSQCWLWGRWQDKWECSVPVEPEARVAAGLQPEVRIHAEVPGSGLQP